EQSRRVQEIFAAHQGEMEAAWTQVHANLQRAMQQATTEIETVLDSAQVERLHAWLAERHGPIAGHAGREHCGKGTTMKTVLLLIATAMACDAGSGAERAGTSAVPDRALA